MKILRTLVILLLILAIIYPLLEAIGFALFGFLSPTRAQFVREGEKAARVTVHVVGDDGRAYEVVRRFGSSSQYYVHDPELGQRIADGNSDLAGVCAEASGSAEVKESGQEALKKIAEYLKKDSSEEDLHAKFFEVTKELDLPPKDFFKAAYLVLIGKETGPRLAPFILAIGKDVAAKKFDTVF